MCSCGGYVVIVRLKVRGESMFGTYQVNEEFTM